MSEFDTVIRNGTVVEATGIPAYRADVAIKDGKIAQMSGQHQGVRGERAGRYGLHRRTRRS